MSSASFCWHCGGKLARKNMAKAGPLLFKEVRVISGETVRVHSVCSKNAAMRTVTAQAAEIARAAVE